MRRAILFLGLVAALIGCGKKPDPTPVPDAPPVVPGPAVTPPTTDPNAGKPKDQPKVLTPVGVIKTGGAAGQGDRNQVHLNEEGKLAAVYLVREKKTQFWGVKAEPVKLKEFPGRISALPPAGVEYLRLGDKAELVNSKTGAVAATLDHHRFLAATFNGGMVAGLTPGDWLEPKKPGIVFARLYFATGKMIDEFEIPTEVAGRNFAFFNDGKGLAIGNRKENRVVFWDLDGKKKLREVTLANPPKDGAGTSAWNNFTVSRDGKFVALERSSGNRVYDGTTGAELTPNDLGDSVGSLVPNRPLYIYYKMRIDSKTSGVVKEYLAYDLQKGAVVATLPLPPESLFHVLSPNGKVMITERDNGELTVWDLTQIP